MKKVLIIAYYWPPAGGAGVQRVLKYAKYLPQFGWEPIILTVNSPDSPIEDLSLLNDVSPNTKIYKTNALEPFNLYKKLTGKKADEKISSDILVDKSKSSFTEKFSRWVRLNIFIPDAKIGWIPYAVKNGLKIINKEKIDLIFSSSPPHTVQIIAKKLAEKSKLKWVVDFRDPWLELIHYQANTRLKFVMNYEAKLEREVLTKADSIITVSNVIKEMFFNKVSRSDVHVIPNGFDETDIKVAQKDSKDQFIVTYTGIISDTKIPTPLFSAVKKMKSEGIHNIKLVFAGSICEKCFEAVKTFNLEEVFEYKGYLPHSESVKLLSKTTILLLLIDNIPNNKGILTGKLFEYLGSKKPIFAIGPTDGDANKIIINTNSGEMINHLEDEKAYILLKKMYNGWINSNFDYKFDVEQYSRKKQTEELSKIFNSHF